MVIKLRNVHIGKAIERRLREIELSQANFAKMRKVSQSAVSKMLSNDSITTSTLKEICLALDYNFFADFCIGMENEREDEIVVKPAPDQKAVVNSGYVPTYLFERILSERDEYMRNMFELKNKVNYLEQALNENPQSQKKKVAG